MTTTSTHRVSARSGWAALVVSVAARAVLSVLVSLLVWSLAPALLGWHPTVVMSGSMQPKLSPGDIVVSRPITSSQLALGQVLLVDSPDEPGQLRLHRLVRFGADGTLILRGDANPTADSSPVARSAVHGVGALHIPYVGRLYLWVTDGRTGPAALTALGLLALLGLAFWWRPARDTEGDTGGDTDDDTQDDTSDGVDEPQSARLHPTPTPVAAGAVTATHGLLARTLLVAVTVAVLVAATAGGADAATKFTKTTSNPTNTWAASTWFTCFNAERGDAAAFAYPLSESSGTTAADISTANVSGTYSGSGVTYGVTGPCTHESRTAVTLDGTAGKITAGSCPSGVALSFEIWFKAAATSQGGGLLSTTNNGGNQTRMALAMTSTGKITFAAGATPATVTTTSSYNNNAWHLAVGTISGSAIALYVDTAAAVTTATPANGTATKCNIGWDAHADLGTGTADFFQGSIGFAAAYTTVLSSAQVLAHYRAAN